MTGWLQKEVETWLVRHECLIGVPAKAKKKVKKKAKMDARKANANANARRQVQLARPHKEKQVCGTAYATCHMPHATCHMPCVAAPTS